MITDINLSWASAAGAIVANAEDITKWIHALFIENTILGDAQKNELEQLISLSNGKPIEKTSAKDPAGFGLGVVQMHDDKIGTYWAYEGQTLGYRAFYIYVPCSGVIISVIFNSSTQSQNDHGKNLIENIYTLLLKENPQLVCKP